MPTLESPKALIFDCDGTVAHTMPLHWRAWQSVTSRYGIDFPETRFYALGGVPGRNILKMLFEEQGIRGLDPLAVAKEKEAAYLEFVHEVRPVEPVVETHGLAPSGHLRLVWSHCDQRRRRAPEAGS